MDIAQTDESTLKKPLRLWPGVVAAVLLILLRFVVPIVAPEATFFGLPATFFGVIGGVFCGLAIVVWWVFLSRAPWPERVGAVGLMIVALFATSRIIHVSIANGAMGMLFPILAIPVLSLAFVAWAVASRRLSKGPRRAAMVATILLACGVWALVRTGGFTANFDNDFAWRWSKTPEERLLGQAGDEPMALAVLSAAPAGVKTGADWPSFRGPSATASFAACGSRPTGLRRRRSSRGAGRSDRAGRPSRSAATSSTPRSSAVTTRSSPATT